MSRLQALAAQPRLALGALLTLLLAAAAVVGSGADFTATSANPANTFSSGTLTIGNSKAGTAVLSATNMRPGDPATTGDVDIENTGSLSGAFTLSHGTIGDSDATNPLSAKLDLVVKDCGSFSGSTAPPCGDGDDVTIYSGTLAAMGQDLGLGNYAAAAKHRYRFSVQLNGAAGNQYQGDSSTVQFDFNAG
jgi:spore coat-associated protein N